MHERHDLFGRSVEIPILWRAATIDSVNEQERTVDVIFSTGADVLRRTLFTGPWIERLAMDPRSVRLGRYNAGAPLLDGHVGDSVRSDQVGAVVPGTARIDNGRGIARIKFSRRPDAEAIFQDVKDGIVRSVSPGYRVHKFQEQAATAATPVIRTAVDWEPYELSLVPMGADPGAQMRSASGDTLNLCYIERSADIVVDDADRLRLLTLELARL